MKSKKVIKQHEISANLKHPKNSESPTGYLNKHPVWAFQSCDIQCQEWSITTCDSFYDVIITKLASFEGMTWGGNTKGIWGKKKGTNSHFEKISDMCNDAQKRAEEIHLDVDELFSLRLTGELRLYGILQDGVFSIIWYDPCHKVYPVKKNGYSNFSVD